MCRKTLDQRNVDKKNVRTKKFWSKDDFGQKKIWGQNKIVSIKGFSQKTLVEKLKV